MNRIDLAQLLANPEAVIRRAITTGEPTEIRVDDSTVRLRATDPTSPQSLLDAAHEARQILDDIEDIAPNDMSTMFYIHAHNELTLALRTLLESIEVTEGGPQDPIPLAGDALGHRGHAESTQGEQALDLGSGDIHDVVRVLNTNLGPTTVQTIAGSHEESAPAQWATPEGPTPPAAVERKLRLAFRVWSILERAQGPSVALAWIVGANPRLGGDVPLQLVIDERATEVIGAALADAQENLGA